MEESQEKFTLKRKNNLTSIQKSNKLEIEDP